MIKNIEKVSQSPDDSLIAMQNRVVEVNRINYHASKIRDELRDLTNSFFTLGFHLFKLKETWSQDLLKRDFYNYCDEEFNLKTTSVKNFINVYKTFKSSNDPEEIDEKFENTSFSALVELLPMSDDKEIASQIKSLPTRQIRDIAKACEDIDSSKDLFDKTFDLIVNLLKAKGIIAKAVINEEGNKHLVVSEPAEADYQFTMDGNVLDDIKLFRLYRWYSYYSKTWFDNRFSLDEINDVIQELIDDVNQIKVGIDEYDSKQTVIDDEEYEDDEEDVVEFPESSWASILGLKDEDEIHDFIHDIKNYVKIFEDKKIRIYQLDPVDYPDLKNDIQAFIFSTNEPLKDYDDDIVGIDRDGEFTNRFMDWEICELFEEARL